MGVQGRTRLPHQPPVTLLPRLGQVLDFGGVLHLGDPAVISQLHSDDGHADERVDLVEQVKTPPRRWQQSLGPRHVQGGDVRIRGDHLLNARLGETQPGDFGAAVRAVSVQNLAAPGADVDAPAAGLDVVGDRLEQAFCGGAVEHAQSGGVGFGSKELEDCQHAACADVFAVQKAEGVRDGVPHAVNAGLRTSMRLEPVGKGHAVQGPDVTHASFGVD